MSAAARPQTLIDSLLPCTKVSKRQRHYAPVRKTPWCVTAGPEHVFAELPGTTDVHKVFSAEWKGNREPKGTKGT